MRGRKEEEEKVAMFPRLNVNDTEKGGPRAPPRNKMALYEQLSIPSHRFNSSSLPHNQGNVHEGTVFPPFYPSPSPSAYSYEKVNSHFTDGKLELKKRSARHVSFKPANAVGSVAEHTISIAQNDSTANSSYQKRINDDDDDFMVPTFVNSVNALHSKETTSAQKKQSIQSHENSTQNDDSDVRSGKYERKSNERKLNSFVDTECVEKLSESRLSKFSSKQEHAGGPDKHHELSSNRVAQSKSESNKPSCSYRSMYEDDICDRPSNEKEIRSLELHDADEISNSSMVDCVPGLDISPDNVVGVIGPKQFWKARRAIINQQRVFAVQLFELHRLIKVQKLLAASPHLLEENSSQKVPINNLLPINSYPKSQPQPIKQKEDSEMEIAAISSIPSYDNNYGNSNGNNVVNKAPQITLPASENNNRANYPWCFPPPTQQWLVPVMSPSEGLVYKPYSTTTVSTSANHANFMPPFYGNYNPMIPPHPQIHNHQPQNYGMLPGAPPPHPMYGIPTINHVISNTAPTNTKHTEQHSRSSCNMSFPKSYHNASKGSELQGSTASSPSERDALPLFPVDPATNNGNEQQTTNRVIRVVPHNNARSATESAARIFRSIQEGRQQLDQ